MWIVEKTISGYREHEGGTHKLDIMILRSDYKDGINVPYILGDATKHEDSLHCSGCKRIFSGEYFCYEGEDFCYKCYKVSHESYIPYQIL